MSKFYTLDENKKPVPCSIEDWSDLIDPRIGLDKRRVGWDIIEGQEISTVFVGVDVGFNKKALLFETMIFDPDRTISFKLNENYCERYTTWQKAEEGHKKAIEWVKNGCKYENED